MRLLINAPAVARSSRGVRRYAERVLAELRWPSGIDTLEPLGTAALERAGELIRRGRAGSILWTPCQRGPLFARNHVVTVHDCISIEYVYRDDWRLPAYLRMMSVLLQRAEIVAISRATRDAILRNFRVNPDRIVVIPSGLDSIPRSAVSLGAPDRPYALLVTNALPHKNTLATCQGFALSRAPREGIALRVIGTLPPSARALCESAGIRLQLDHSIDDDALASAYAGCAFLLAPSLSEGHDLPVAEALSQGAEVLCSDIPVHHEFYEGRVRFFDPTRVEAIAAAIDDAMTVPRPWFSARGVTPDRGFADVARDYEALFRSIEARGA